MWREVQPEDWPNSSSDWDHGTDSCSPFLPDQVLREPLAESSLEDSFVILGERGHDGICTVCQALDKARGRIVGLRVLTGRELAAAVCKALFERERHLLESVEDSRHVIRVLETREYRTNGELLPVQLVEPALGGSLRVSLRQRGDEALPLAKCVEIFADVSKAAATLHKAGLCHGNIHPATVVRVDSTWKLGGTLWLISDRAEENALLGLLGTPGWLPTPAYSAPEFRPGHHPDKRSDVYALGILFAVILSPGVEPAITCMNDPNRAERLHHAVRGLQHLPYSLRLILATCVHPDPGERFGNATQLCETLEGLRNKHPNLFQERTDPPGPRFPSQPLLGQAQSAYPTHPHAYTACTAMEERIAVYNRLVREALAAARQGLWETARQRLEAALETLPTAPGLSSALDAVTDVQKAVLFFQRKIQSLAGSNGAARQYEVALAQFLEQRARPTVAQIGRSLCTLNP
jgi:Protein kinase domain